MKYSQIAMTTAIPVMAQFSTYIQPERKAPFEPNSSPEQEANEPVRWRPIARRLP
ncbi:hypothetical protein GCM10023166_23750 [Paeniglutamicibacter cryotolerans]